VDEEDAITEADKDNNVIETRVTVADYPDLVAIDLSFIINGKAGNKANLNDTVQIMAVIYNNGESSASGFDVVFKMNESVIGVVPVAHLAVQGTTTVGIYWDPSTMTSISQLNQLNIIAVVNPPSDPAYTHVPEMDDPTNDNNRASQVLEVKDNRPDIAVTGITVSSNNVNVTSGTQGERVVISFEVQNRGLVDATNVAVRVYLDGEERVVLFEQQRNIGKDETVMYDVPWTVNVTMANYSLVVSASVSVDSNPTNNEVEASFKVVVLNPDIEITLSKTDYSPGDAIIVEGRVTQGDQKAPLAGLTVTVVLTDVTGLPISVPQSAKTDANGYFLAIIQTPSGKEGDQLVKVTVGDASEVSSIRIVAPFTPQSIPTWVYLLIVAIVIAVIVIFSIYLYRVGLGRMVECGNCGALIPEASKHCPKCGVEFEADTAKCSECGAWIPVKAESCPECGAKFLTEPLEGEEGSGYIETMRKQYDDYIEGFRSQAKAALGNKYSEEKFQEWLKTEPNFLPFEEWLRKEEMGRKSGVFACPACGTLNPKDAKVCNRCGTVFEQPKAEPQAPKAEEKEKKGTFRRIVRRASEPKPEKPSQAEAPSEAEEGKEVSKPEEGERPK
ncbi:MAG TPA: CARDB domain-containing protein, partial [Methanomassiliicoccales archaeon]|nr:CARDB domain-containing protein [Methanomassiliicoccales archaeon]